MHELAIAKSLIDTASALLPSHAPHVTNLTIQLGALAGVSEDELRFGIECMAAGTPCEGSQIDITHIPAIAHCPQCNLDFPLAETELLFCPSCGTPAVTVIQGKELLITSIKVSDEAVYE